MWHRQGSPIRQPQGKRYEWSGMQGLTNTRHIHRGLHLSSTEHAVYGPLERLAADARNSAKDVKSRR